MSHQLSNPEMSGASQASPRLAIPDVDLIGNAPVEDDDMPEATADYRRSNRRNHRQNGLSENQSNARTYSISFRDDGGSFIEEIGRRSENRNQRRDPNQRFRRNSVTITNRMAVEPSTEDESAPLLSQSVGSPSYSSMKDTFATEGAPVVNKDSTPFIFCIHGNKYGVARCCEDIANDSIPHSGPTSLTTESIEGGLTNRGFSSVEMERGRLDDDEANSDSSKGLHCHSHAKPHGIDKKARNKLLLALVLCFVFMIVEIVGGVISGSLAIMTDAAHLLTDVAAFCVSLFSIYMAGRPATQTMSFGYHRIEVLGAIVSVLLIWLVTGALVIVAIERIISGDFEIDAGIMLITSGLGLFMGCTLHQHAHSHGGSDDGHNHSHGGGQNINVTAAYIHVIGDFIQSLGVFVAALLIYFMPDWYLADPICTFLFSVLVLATTGNILKRTLQVLMEGIPNGVSFQVVQDTLNNVEGIVSVHNIRIWSLTTEKIAMSAHLAITPGTNAQNVLMEASQKIRVKYDIHEMTLQVENYQEDMRDCSNCQNPVK
ncbi:hypothetical protein TCAL_10542 [Tigriopus californicus]|uniref:Cation efflux protein cytoplasmic domain-containing protein n=1 Tax=Tigriopus californicus TaxID=6832 RepID=A0A553P447_TIGCA|nr:hypothetical protein TCAL_10542 [Tigriopus californicus]|eukprot:TCALIF_10542-PA protein Name:"Similar to Slc30a2 Zinc transporter 2 (Mus musculus)" AED:0.11 eAED:0.11 QI:224/0.85/0.87/1/0.71/0.75/8/206/542